MHSLLSTLIYTQMLMHATGHRGCKDTIRESALKVDSASVLHLAFQLDALPSELSQPIIFFTSFDLSNILSRPQTVGATTGVEDFYSLKYILLQNLVSIPFSVTSEQKSCHQQCTWVRTSVEGSLHGEGWDVCNFLFWSVRTLSRSM